MQPQPISPTDWQALWDATEELYDQFREAKTGLEDEHINACLGYLDALQSEIEGNDQAI